MKTLILKNISKETQLVRVSASANKEELKAGKTLKIEKSFAEQYAKSYPKLFQINGKGELVIDEVLSFCKNTSDEERLKIADALGGKGELMQKITNLMNVVEELKGKNEELEKFKAESEDKKEEKKNEVAPVENEEKE